MTHPVVTIDREAAQKALRAAAYVQRYEDTGEDRERIHTFAGGTMIFMGADWDLTEALEFLADADEVAWCIHPMRHDLAVRVDERVMFFDVPNPDREAD